MNRLFCISIVCIFISPICLAQKKTKTSGEAQIELTKDKSRLEVEKEAENLATINALERAFGRVVVQGNSTYLCTKILHMI